ncbi:MAG TPA: hypothetical protein VNJ01_00705 [Bacteriovoracaceae bacterium]|nr:hypothetical protein [Bacteriovoracaceae bacterium]
MKTLILTLFILIASKNSYATKLGWVCLLDDRADEQTLRTLKFPGYLPEIGILTVIPRLCNKPGPANLTDTCVVKGHSIFIGNDPQSSSLKLKNGKTVSLRCEESRVVEAQPSHGGSK